MCDQIGESKNCFEEVVKSCFERFRVSDEHRVTEPEIYLIHISFELIEDRETRAHFQSIPTSLQLPREDVDALIDIAPELIKETPDFHLLMQDLDARIVD